MTLLCGLRTSNNLAKVFWGGDDKICVIQTSLSVPSHGLLRLHTALVLAGGCDPAAQEAIVYRLLNHISIQGQIFGSQKIFLLLLFSSFQNPLSPLSSTIVHFSVSLWRKSHVSSESVSRPAAACLVAAFTYRCLKASASHRRALPCPTQWLFHP